MFVSAGFQTIVALREMKEWTSQKKTLDHDIDPLASVHYADLKPLVNSFIQQLVHIKSDVAIHGRDLHLLRPTLGPPKKFQHLTRAEEVVINYQLALSWQY